MKETNSYTALDIARYHSGQLSSAEMNAIERAALNDPFLSDALEGYAWTKTPIDDLKSLTQKLEERVSGNRSKRVFSIGNTWVKIAALFIVLAGGGWLVFQTLSTSNQGKALAVNKDKQNASAEDAPYKAADSIISVPSSQNNEDMVLQSDKETNKVTTEKVSAPSLATPPNKTMKDEGKKDVAISKGEDERSLAPSAVQPLRDNSLAEVVITKEADKAKVRGVTIADTIKNFDVVMQNEEMDSKNVVVVSKGKVKSAIHKDRVVIDTLEPAQGWTNFDDYIASNLKPPEELKLKSVSGEVELSFEVNSEGTPINIAVTKSLCEKCDKEAIRLLHDGPKWNKKKTKGTVKIKF